MMASTRLEGSLPVLGSKLERSRAETAVHSHRGQTRVHGPSGVGWGHGPSGLEPGQVEISIVSSPMCRVPTLGVDHVSGGRMMHRGDGSRGSLHMCQPPSSENGRITSALTWN